MASKVIFDSPQLLEESLISLTEACRCFPVKCSRPALERWIRRGSRGVVLESILICGKRFTSREAVQRFIRQQLQVGAEQPPPKIGAKSRQEIETASKKYGLPEPQEVAGE